MTDDSVTRSLDLVRAAQGGDDTALNRLFERYYERVRRVVRMRLGKRLRTALDSGDILQETFTAAVRSFDSFEMRDEASLINWLSKLAERQIIAAADYHGAKKRDRRREVALANPISGEVAAEFKFEYTANTPLPDEKAADEEQAAVMESCVGELSEEYRELVILRHYVGASWETVAEITQRPSPDAARMMHARAMIELGRLLKEKGAKP